ncbi:hypothetical protein D3C87_1575590 [compost metagenome]
METRSSSVLRGGDSLKKVRYSPMSFSLSDKWLIEMPQVTFAPRPRATFIASTDSGTEILAAWYLALVRAAILRSRSNGMISASLGTPDRPSQLANSPSFITPLPRYLSRSSSEMTASNSRA